LDLQHHHYSLKWSGLLKKNLQNGKLLSQQDMLALTQQLKISYKEFC